MSFLQWNQWYNDDKHISIWPFTDVISYCMRYTDISRHEKAPHLDVLELGCGAGANIPFFLEHNVNYYSVEGSDSAVKNVIIKYPELKNRIMQGNFTKEIPFDKKFDVVFDRASLSHNSTDSIQRCIDNIYKNYLKKSGKYIGIDWYATEDIDFKGGNSTEDIYTRTDFITGRFAGLGPIHFSDESHLLQIFHQFRIEELKHKAITSKIPDNESFFAYWNFVAVREDKE